MDSFFNLHPVRTLQRVCAINLIFQRKTNFQIKKFGKLISWLISLKQTEFCGLEIELNYFFHQFRHLRNTRGPPDFGSGSNRAVYLCTTPPGVSVRFQGISHDLISIATHNFCRLQPDGVATASRGTEGNRIMHSGFH